MRLGSHPVGGALHLKHFEGVLQIRKADSSKISDRGDRTSHEDRIIH